jgi:hypothetical protein
MSLLGHQVYANPTTPIWGQGGGGGGSNFQTLNITPRGGNLNIALPDTGGNGGLNFYKNDSGTSFAQLQMFPNPAVVGTEVLSVFDSSGTADTLQVGDLQAAGTGSLPGADPPALSLGMAGTGTLGLRLVDTDVGGVTATYATFASNAFDLSNVTSINGVPYFNSPGTQFDYRNYPGGSPLVEAPDWGVLNAISFTAPVDGKVYVESLGTYVALVTGGGVSMTFAVDGTNISETPTTFNAYAGNTNLFGTSMFQFPVSANVTYDISSIAHCSAIPPSDPDVVITSSRMFLLFSPQ